MTEEEERFDLGPVLANAFVLVIKLLFTAMRFKRKARKAAHTFSKAAVKNGMDRQLARQLGEEYADYGSIRKLMKSAMVDKKIPFMN